MVPIQQQFVGDLLGASPQLSLLSSPEAILLKERAYFSSPRTAKVLTEGVPLLFYESGTGGGRKCVIAAGRIRQTRVIGKTDIETEIEGKGVLTTESLDSLISGSKVAVTTFDNIMHFENPVSLRRLREIGYVDKSNFRTARQISSVHLLSILEEGKAYGRAR